MTVIYQTKMCENPEEAVVPASRDVVDQLPSKARATNWDIAGFIISIICHIVDVFFDCNIAYRYYSNSEYGYFFATLAFILIPALINTAFSIRMYVLDHENLNRSATLTKKITKRRLCCIIVLVFQLAPVLRYFEALQYARKSRKAERAKDVENQRKYYELMVKEDSDVALLRVLECFLEAAPQQALQLSIIFAVKKERRTVEFSMAYVLRISPQLLSIGSSFVSMAWSMASYQRVLRFSLKNKQNISWPGTVVQFLWHFCVTVSRILCISVISTMFPKSTIAVICLHWFVMTAWLFYANQENNFCEHNHLYDVMFYSIFGTVYIFTHVTLVDGPTWKKYLFFYSILFIENTVANVMWILNADSTLRAAFYYQPIIYLNVIPFCAGIVFMILYYTVLHPSTGYNRQQQSII